MDTLSSQEINDAENASKGITLFMSENASKGTTCMSEFRRYLWKYYFADSTGDYNVAIGQAAS